MLTWLSPLLSSSVDASVDLAGQILTQVYGSNVTGCTQTAVTTSGANRAGPFVKGRRYLVYGYSGTSSTDMSAVSIKCVQGSSTIDVTALGGGLVGQIIFSGQQQIFLFQGSTLYISCISAVATQKYDVCPLD